MIQAELQPVPQDVALVLPTSGTTGPPKLVMLTRGALHTSAVATHQVLGGPGRWLLALPLNHVAGCQVVVRSLLAGQVPHVMPPGSFSPSGFSQAVRESDCRYTSLVPTQLSRVLADDDATAAASSLNAILVGGAAVRRGLLTRAREAGLRVVRTYGMTETAGGCVYEGISLPGVDVELEADGRIRIAGQMLASGYLGRPELTDERFVQQGTTRWLRTDDLGEISHGNLRVLGRLDDVIITGGENVAPAVVEAAIESLPGVEDVVVVGVPDAEWGQRIVALVVGPADPATVRAHVAEQCGRAAVPKAIHTVEAVPMLGIGKPDRRAARMLAERLE